MRAEPPSIGKPALGIMGRFVVSGFGATGAGATSSLNDGVFSSSEGFTGSEGFAEGRGGSSGTVAVVEVVAGFSVGFDAAVFNDVLKETNI